jgi:hypothetical protein
VLALLNSTGSWIDAIRINAITDEVRNGRPVWVKWRRRGSRKYIHAANLFFRLARNPVSVCVQIEHWRRWEIECFQLLHGESYRAFPGGPCEVCADRLPGETLCRRLSENRLTAPILHAAGRELRRAHALYSSRFDGPWSHGDAHLGNFLYDERTGRCRLIDFEVMHRRSMSADERHANDLLTPLLDLMGRAEERDWIPFSLEFIRGYDRLEIVRLLRQSLSVPGGVPRLWWAIRTGFIGSDEMKRRVLDLGRHLV